MRSDYDSRLDSAGKAIGQAEGILIGAGAGLSAAAGLTYDGERFERYFGDFIRKYGVEDMYSATFYPYGTQEEMWAYWARHIAVNRWDVQALPLYQKLFQLVKGKDYFVLTTNVDAQFEKAGFSKERLFAVQGDYGFLQCAQGCHEKLYENEGMVHEMVKQTTCLKIPTELVPHCPVCGGNMAVHVRKDPYFVEDEAWRQSHARYGNYLKRALDKKTVLLELGVGYNTPGIIRFPFERIAYQSADTMLIRINKGNPEGARENAHCTVPFTEAMESVMHDLLERIKR